MDENKESDVMWKGGCSDFIDKYGSTKGNKPNKGWTTTFWILAWDKKTVVHPLVNLVPL
jgi:hypothetical protein